MEERSASECVYCFGGYIHQDAASFGAHIRRQVLRRLPFGSYAIRSAHAPRIQIARGRLPEFLRKSMLAHANTSPFSLAARCVMDELDSPFARPLEGRDKPQRRMSPIWESYCATRSRSSLHTEASTEPLRERLDQSEARQATFGVLQIEAEPLVLHTELV